MRKFWRKMKALFSGEEERSYWTVALQAKYTDVGVNLETYVSGHVFEKWVQAARFAAWLEEKFSKSNNILGVVEIRTAYPLTVTDIDYDVTDERGNHQVCYRWPEGVDHSAQDLAEDKARNRNNMAAMLRSAQALKEDRETQAQAPRTPRARRQKRPRQ